MSAEPTNSNQTPNIISLSDRVIGFWSKSKVSIHREVQLVVSIAAVLIDLNKEIVFIKPSAQSLYVDRLRTTTTYCRLSDHFSCIHNAVVVVIADDPDISISS